MSSKKIIFRILVNSLLGAVLVFVWTRFVDIGQTWDLLKTAQPQFSILFFLFFLVSTVLRGLRLRVLLKGYKISLKDVAFLNLLSQFLSFMVPIRLGELTKSVYLSSQFNIPFGKALTWVFVDRFLDFWVVLLLIGSFLIFTPTNIPANLAKSIFLVFGVFTAASVVVLVSQELANKLVDFFSKFIPHQGIRERLVNFAKTVIEGFEVLRRYPQSVLIMIFLTVIAIVFDSLIFYVSFLSLGKDIGLSKSILGDTLSALTFLVPAAPGYVGSAEAGILAVFSGILGIESNLVSAASVFFHILTIVILLVAGLTSLYFLKFDLNLVWKKVKGG